MSKSLVMVFKSESKDNVTITVNNVKEDLKEIEVVELMDAILLANIFDIKGGNLVTKEKAKIVSKNIEVLTLA